MKYFLGVMVITVNIIMMTHACNFTCPKNKPYCSNAGCVFECLHPFFMNGTYCVADCGHLFVDRDRHCIETCPAGSFILETLQQVNANQYLERKSVKCNVTEGFIQNNECVKLCPENMKYIEDENQARCIQTCPADNSFTTEVQRFGVSHNQCVAECLDPFYTNDTNCVEECEHFYVDTNRHCSENCPSETFSMGKRCVLCNKYEEFVKGDECVHSCPERWNFIQDEHHAKCLQECPIDAPFINRINYFGGEHSQCVANCPDLVDDKYCVSSCPNGKVRYGKHCLYDCPASNPYMFNGDCHSKCQTSDINLITDNFTCVKICPHERPFIMNTSCVSNCPEVISIDKYCASKCGEHEILFNNSCLEFCPPLTVTFNRTCIEECPAESPLACRTTKGQTCGSDPDNNEAHTVCVYRCPDNMFVWKNTCLYECPSGIPSVARECREECPFYSPYQISYYLNSGCNFRGCVNSKLMLKCTAECPDNTFVFNRTCFFYCPSPLFQFEKNCIAKCPDNSPVRINSTVSINVWELQNSYWYGSRFVSKSKTIDVVKCVSSCDTSLVQVDSMCSDKCPDTAPFVHDRVCYNDSCTTKYIKYAEIGIVCIESCDGYIVENNYICYRKCPQTLIVYNRSCVAECPNSHRYVVQSTYENCYYPCAPENLRFECTAVCPKGYFSKQYQCVNFCEPPLYTFQNECLSTCPISAQYIDDSIIQVSVFKNFSTYIKMINVGQHIRSCVGVCPSNKVLNGQICAESCPIHSIFIRNRTCSKETCSTKWTYRESGLGIFCLDECPEYTLKYNQTCVSRCPITHKVFESACVPYCPLSAQFTSKEPRETDLFNCTSNNLVGKICSNASHHICKKECPYDSYIVGKTCVARCPDDHFIFGQLCLKQCPISAPFIQPIRILLQHGFRIFMQIVICFGFNLLNK